MHPHIAASPISASPCTPTGRLPVHWCGCCTHLHRSSACSACPARCPRSETRRACKQGRQDCGMGEEHPSVTRSCTLWHKTSERGTFRQSPASPPTPRIPPAALGDVVQHEAAAPQVAVAQRVWVGGLRRVGGWGWGGWVGDGGWWGVNPGGDSRHACNPRLQHTRARPPPPPPPPPTPHPTPHPTHTPPPHTHHPPASHAPQPPKRKAGRALTCSASSTQGESRKNGNRGFTQRPTCTQMGELRRSGSDMSAPAAEAAGAGAGAAAGEAAAATAPNGSRSGSGGSSTTNRKACLFHESGVDVFERSDAGDSWRIKLCANAATRKERRGA